MRVEAVLRSRARLEPVVCVLLLDGEFDVAESIVDKILDHFPRIRTGPEPLLIALFFEQRTLSRKIAQLEFRTKSAMDRHIAADAICIAVDYHDTYSLSRLLDIPFKRFIGMFEWLANDGDIEVYDSTADGFSKEDPVLQAFFAYLEAWAYSEELSELSSHEFSDESLVTRSTYLSSPTRSMQ